MDFDSKPFGFKDSEGKIQGLEADLSREIAKRIFGDENKIIFKHVKSQDRIKTAMSDEVDMVISAITINNERKKFVYFSKPYFIAGQAICVKSDRKFDSIYDLMNKRIIVELGTTGEKNIKRFIPTALIRGYAHSSEAMEAFKNGDGDAITTDDALLQGFVIDNPEYMILPIRLTKEPYGIAFKKSKQSKNFKKQVDKIINDMNSDGTIDALKNKWILY